MTFAERLALAMRKNGLGVKQVSTLTGFSKSAVLRWLAEETEPAEKMKPMIFEIINKARA